MSYYEATILPVPYPVYIPDTREKDLAFSKQLIENLNQNNDERDTMTKHPLGDTKAQHLSQKGHYLEAERCLACAEEIGSRGGNPANMIMVAQVHATLATCESIETGTESYNELTSLGQNPEDWEIYYKEKD